jgi:hypothetical protein
MAGFETVLDNVLLLLLLLLGQGVNIYTEWLLSDCLIAKWKKTPTSLEA